MRKQLFLILALIAVMAIPSVSSAQRPGGGQGRGRGQFGGGFGMELFLLGQESVKKELQLADDQATKLRELGEKQRESFGNFRDLSEDERRAKFEENRKALDAGLAEILKSEQVARLKQIALQQRGPSAIGDPVVAASLDLSADQKAKVTAIEEAGREEMRSLRDAGSPEEGREKFQAFRKAQGEKYLAVLTTEQQGKWKELLGAEFTGEIERPRFGGGPGGQGGGRRRGGDN
jgi:Spy/CpxP family protein refolding chaperone